MCVLVGTALAEPEPATVPLLEGQENSTLRHVDGTSPVNTADQIILHQRNKERLQAAGIGMDRVRSEDRGDVAVLVDDGVIVLPAFEENLFDLSSGTSLNFDPVGPDEFRVSRRRSDLDPVFGDALPLGDDETVEVAFPAGFPFLGTIYPSVFVNSNGNITLGAGDPLNRSSSAGGHVFGLPRISGLLTDLDPARNGSVHADVRADRVVVTWNGVSQFNGDELNTFQIVLHASGAVDLNYGDMLARVGVVGIAAGMNAQPFNAIDYSNKLPATFKAGAIFEAFFFGREFPILDTLMASKLFYETHEDKYDYLVFFTDFVSFASNAFAFHLGIQNNTEGIGFRRNGRSARLNFLSFTGSEGELESILHMNRIGLYWSTPEKLVNPPVQDFDIRVLAGNSDDEESMRARHLGTFNGDFGAHGPYTLGLNSGMTILAHEVGHRWLAFPAIEPPAPDVASLDLLGNGVHWSFFFNTETPAAQFPDGSPRSSVLDGNVIEQIGPDSRCPGQTLFQTPENGLVDGYNLFDQYFMGLIPAEEVPPFFYVKNATAISATGEPLQTNRNTRARSNILICGDRQDLTLADVFAFNSASGGLFPSNGPREVFDREGNSLGVILGDEIDQDAAGNDVRDVKTMAFILVVRDATGIPQSAVDHVDTFRRTAEEYLNGPATAGRGRFDTSLDPDVH